MRSGALAGAEPATKLGMAYGFNFVPCGFRPLIKKWVFLEKDLVGVLKAPTLAIIMACIIGCRAKPSTCPKN